MSSGKELDKETIARERRAYLVARAGRSRLAGTMGYRLHYDADGAAVLTLPYNASLDNGMGALHGGIIAALIDTSAWYAAAPHYPNWIATVELQTRLLEPAAEVELRAVGRVIRAGRRIAVAEVEVLTADGRRIATGDGTFAATSRPWEPPPDDADGGSGSEVTR
jgi:uncharacterized protein (TIGR00369 family)